MTPGHPPPLNEKKPFYKAILESSTPMLQPADGIPETDLLPSLLNLSKSPAESHDAWKIFTKAKSALQNGARLENISWRLYHMKLAKEKEINKKKKNIFGLPVVDFGLCRIIKKNGILF